MEDAQGSTTEDSRCLFLTSLKDETDPRQQLFQTLQESNKSITASEVTPTYSDGNHVHRKKLY